MEYVEGKWVKMKNAECKSKAEGKNLESSNIINKTPSMISQD